MTANQLIDAIRLRFAEALQAKTGWGRVEAMAAFERAVSGALGEVQLQPSPVMSSCCQAAEYGRACSCRRSSVTIPDCSKPVGSGRNYRQCRLSVGHPGLCE